jgi:hypothetical protein
MQKIWLAAVGGIVAATGLASSAQAQTPAAEPMSFFITSESSGEKGANLGGLEGADAICQRLGTAAGSTLTWHAYLSTSSFGGGKIVNARDRIGNGPWYNAKGQLIARTLDELHSPKVPINKQTALTEKGAVVNGRGDTPNQHDILTGSRPDGTAMAGATDTTCKNWTSSTEGTAMLGHHDRTGLDVDPPSLSWNSAHLSRGCTQDNLKSSGGAGQLYCFAVR